MSLPPPTGGATPPLPMAPLLTPLVTSAGTSLVGPISTAAPTTLPPPGSSPPPPAFFPSSEKIAATLQPLVAAVQGLQLQQQQYGAAPYASPPPAPFPAYGHAPWPLQATHAYGGPLLVSSQAPGSHGPPPASALLARGARVFRGLLAGPAAAAGCAPGPPGRPVLRVLADREQCRSTCTAGITHQSSAVSPVSVSPAGVGGGVVSFAGLQHGLGHADPVTAVWR